MVGAGRLDHGVEPRADPVEAADASASPGFRVSQHHEGGRRDVPEPSCLELATVEPFEHHFSKPFEREQRLDPFGREQEMGVIGQMNGPAQVGDAEREVAADLAAEPGRCARASASQAARCSGAWKVRIWPGPKGAGELSTSSSDSDGISLARICASKSSTSTSAAPTSMCKTRASQERTASGPSPSKRSPARARKRASSRASSKERDWRVLVQRGKLGSPGADRAKRIDCSRRQNSRARPSRTKRSWGNRRSAYAASRVPIGAPFSMTRTVSSELMVPTLFQNQRATRRLRSPNLPSRTQRRGAVQRTEAPASGSVAPGGAASLPARKSRQESKSARESSIIGPALRIKSKAALADCSPKLAMPINCWQRTSSGARIIPSGSTRPSREAWAVIAAPAKSAGVAARSRPCETASRRWPARPTRCKQRATPPGEPT